MFLPPCLDWLTVQQCALQCGVPRYDAEAHAGHLQQGNIEHIFGDFWRTSFSALEDRVAAVAAEVGLHLSIFSLHSVSAKYRDFYRNILYIYIHISISAGGCLRAGRLRGDRLHPGHGRHADNPGHGEERGQPGHGGWREYAHVDYSWRG